MSSQLSKSAAAPDCWSLWLPAVVDVGLGVLLLGIRERPLFTAVLGLINGAGRGLWMDAEAGLCPRSLLVE